MNAPGINGIDFLVIAVMVWGATAGFFRGVFRQAFSLVVLYLATTLASQYYRPITRWLTGISNSAQTGHYVLTFLIILVCAYVLLGLIASDILRTYGTERPLSLKGLGELGGMALGLVHASLSVGLILVLFTFALSTPWWEWEPARQMLQSQMNHSALASLFSQYLSQTAVTLLPWLPSGLPPVLVSAL